MEPVYTQLTQRALDLRKKVQESSLSRVIIVLAGPPGSGKSTVAAQVVQRINALHDHQVAAVLPMDGFHYSRAYLDTLPNHQEAHARRGVYWTFDADGVLNLVKLLYESRKGGTVTIRAPSFDHEAKDPVADALEISTDIEIVIVEGNWLLYNQHPWSQIANYADDTWFVDVDSSLALQRVAARHVASGIEGTLEAALIRAEDNDMKNGDEVRKCLIKPNITVESIEDIQKHTPV